MCKQNVRWVVGGFVGALLLFLAAGCTGIGGTGGAEGQTGTLQVALTDAASDFEEVWISIVEVRVVPGEPEQTGETGEEPPADGEQGAEGGDGEDADTPVQTEQADEGGTGEDEATTGDTDGGAEEEEPVIVSFDPPKQVNILELNLKQEVLGENEVPAGSYSQIRLILAPNEGEEPANYVILKSEPGVKYPLKTPSAQQSGLKILGQYEVEPGILNAIVLDFDPDKAIVERGQGASRNERFILKPTGIRIVQIENPLDQFGALVGTVLPDEAWPSAVVSIVPADGGAAVASGSVNPDDGSFRAFLPAGSYFVKVTADGFEPYDSSQGEGAAPYVVTVGQETLIETPIELVPVGGTTDTGGTTP